MDFTRQPFVLLKRSGHKDQLVFYVVLVVLGAVALVAISLLKPKLSSDPHALGLHVVSMFVPYACCAVLLAYLIVFDLLNRTTLITVGTLFILLAAGFYDLFFIPIEHYQWDDPDRHSVYAHNIVEQGSLFGSDYLRWGAEIAHYMDQPGFRYYLALLILALGGEHRLLQLFSLFFYLVTLLLFLNETKKFLPRHWLFWFGIFLVACLPYAAKNIIQGLSEWLSVALTFLYATCLLRRKYLIAILLIALVPFVRQNLLLFSLALGLFTVYVSKRFWLLVPYFLVLLLPLYHNLYYAGEFRLLVENKGALLSVNEGLMNVVPQILDTLAWKALTYLGYAQDVDILTLILGALFVPLGTILVLSQFVAFHEKERWFYIFVAILAIGPTLLFGSAYFPRFVFVNQCVVLIAAVLIRGEFE